MCVRSRQWATMGHREHRNIKTERRVCIQRNKHGEAGLQASPRGHSGTHYCCCLWLCSRRRFETMSWFRGKKEPEPEPTPEPTFSADTSAFEGSTNFASGPPSRGAGGGGGAAGMADLQVRPVRQQTAGGGCVLLLYRDRSAVEVRLYILHMVGEAAAVAHCFVLRTKLSWIRRKHDTRNTPPPSPRASTAHSVRGGCSPSP